MAEDAAQEIPVVRRRRKFTATTLAQTFIFGFLAKPRASDEDLAQTAALCGVAVTPQAIEQRFTTRMADFLEVLFRKAIGHVVASQRALAPLLERFPAVLLLDSSTITLPNALADRFPGCGGSHGGGQAAMKLQVQWDLRSGALQALALEAGRQCDYSTPLQSQALPPGALRITDLGYFDTKVFQRLDQERVFWLSRLQFGTTVFSPEGQALPLRDWLQSQPGPFIDQPIRLGTQQKILCRLVAWRVPAEVANRRRQKLLIETRRKDGRVPSQERLAWCDWTILVTNVPAELLTSREVAIMYRARWQIELLFKRWKSLGLIAELAGATVARQMVRLWSRLLAVLVQHWLLLSTAWGDPRCSLAKACKVLRDHALLLPAALGSRSQLKKTIERLANLMRMSAKQNRRKKPSTFELINDPSLLEYDLT